MKKSYSLALELDRLFKLNLSNNQFEILVSHIDGYENSQNYFNNLISSSPAEIMIILKNIKK